MLMTAVGRGVSGGERKRVSVGHELLIDPSILMLDGTQPVAVTTTAQLLPLLTSRLHTPPECARVFTAKPLTRASALQSPHLGWTPRQPCTC